MTAPARSETPTPSTDREAKPFDPACLELAKHFLPDALEHVQRTLAEEIQDAIEAFLTWNKL